MKHRNQPSRIRELVSTFAIPLTVLLGIVASLITQYVFHLDFVSNTILIGIILLGSYQLIVETARSLWQRQFALDYIALLAISVGVGTQNYLVASVIVLMLSGGNKLEEYAMTKAKSSLTALVDRIPHVVLIEDTKEELQIEKVEVGMKILVRKGEVIPLDGTLLSDTGLTDESSLTGEPYMMEKKKGDLLRSGTLNVGGAITVAVTRAEKDSTYRKIIDMVANAQEEKSPIIRLANKYSTIFTLITLAIGAGAYVVSGDINRVLAVLVIATPCPLILATPIALMGGMNTAARKRIIIKRLASIEVLSRVQAFIFDKTGTITLGKPVVTDIEIFDSTYTEAKVLGIAAAIEHNSLHPLAKAVVKKAADAHIPELRVTDVEEKIGVGITGIINKKSFLLARAKDADGMKIELTSGRKKIAHFHFRDQLKENSKKIVDDLHNQGLDVAIYTGDKQRAADEIASLLGSHITVKAECTPEDKQKGIAQLHAQKKTVVMIGDGINDAPALASADVGMVFSSDEHTAASEAADVVFLGGDFKSVSDVHSISKKTIQIALQSIVVGIGLSVVGMLIASAGFIAPIIGAFIQETIDILVIFNALRTSRLEV